MSSLEDSSDGIIIVYVQGYDLKSSTFQRSLISTPPVSPSSNRISDDKYFSIQVLAGGRNIITYRGGIQYWVVSLKIVSKGTRMFRNVSFRSESWTVSTISHDVFYIYCHLARRPISFRFSKRYHKTKEEDDMISIPIMCQVNDIISYHSQLNNSPIPQYREIKPLLSDEPISAWFSASACAFFRPFPGPRVASTDQKHACYIYLTWCGGFPQLSLLR